MPIFSPAMGGSRHCQQQCSGAQDEQIALWGCSVFNLGHWNMHLRPSLALRAALKCPLLNRPWAGIVGISECAGTTVSIRMSAVPGFRRWDGRAASSRCPRFAQKMKRPRSTRQSRPGPFLRSGAMGIRASWSDAADLRMASTLREI